MSGPVSPSDVRPREGGPAVAPTPILEVTPSRTTEVGGLTVRRALPRRGRRTVGAWCFVDHLGPAQVTDASGVEVGRTRTPVWPRGAAPGDMVEVRQGTPRRRTARASARSG